MKVEAYNYKKELEKKDKLLEAMQAQIRALTAGAPQSAGAKAAQEATEKAAAALTKQQANKKGQRLLSSFDVTQTT